jgi:ABC-type bacteriocin/lantibiotic exporter with double-glycine peptidase domain
MLALVIVLSVPWWGLRDQQGRTAHAVRETARMSCGPAALLAALSTLDSEAAWRLSEILAAEAPAAGAPSSFHDLATWAERVGRGAVGLRVGSESLVRVPLPAIAHLQPGHFVVLHKVSEARVVISERSTRPHSLTRADFERLFSGNVLCLQRRSTGTG